MSVDILMATYNGGKYIENQLLSLQQQTYRNWLLWISDDGSTDDTLLIAKRFADNDNRINIINNPIKKSGAAKNFLHLTKYANNQYIIFCDQDDIWFEKKIELLVENAEKVFLAETPSLIYCDAYGYSNDEGIINTYSISLNHAKNLREFLFFNSGYQGSSILFNNHLCELVKNYHADYIYMHDDIVSLLAHVFGNVFYMPKCLMLYRQHSANLTGNVSVGLINRLITFFRSSRCVISDTHYNEKKSFFDAYGDSITLKNKRIFCAYLSYPHHSRLGRLWIILRHRFSIGGLFLPLIIKTLLRRPIG